MLKLQTQHTRRLSSVLGVCLAAALAAGCAQGSNSTMGGPGASATDGYPAKGNASPSGTLGSSSSGGAGAAGSGTAGSPAGSGPGTAGTGAGGAGGAGAAGGTGSGTGGTAR